jgi:hypothetical protein
MAFKIKDLMINVLPSDPLGCGHTNDCTPTHETTLHDIWNIFLLAGGRCTFFSLVQCGATIGPTDIYQSQGSSVTALSALKEQLKRHLAEVEKQQAAAEERLQPQTVEEIDMLTNKLNDALQELKGRRAELSKKSKPARNK